MAKATKTDGQWTILPGGEPVHHDDVVASYETVQGWSQGEREAFGVFDIGEGLSPPEGYRISSSEIGERDGRPIWVHTFEAVASPEPNPMDAWIPVEVMRERAEALGIWAALAGYLAQNPELMLKVLTLRSGRVNPEDEDLITGLVACEVPAAARAILLAPMT